MGSTATLEHRCDCCDRPLWYDEPAPLAWRDRAGCRDVDLDIFFPGRGDSAGGVARAKTFCATCPVVDECLAVGMARPASEDLVGIFGGLTAAQRLELRR
jgi:WhiB family redox-sensing transcriptional regulator